MSFNSIGGGAYSENERNNKENHICWQTNAAFCHFYSRNILCVDKCFLLFFPETTSSVRNMQYKIAPVGSVVKFGRYEQDGNLDNGPEDIKWIVLAREDNKLLLISKYSLLTSSYVPSTEFWECAKKNMPLNLAWESSVARSVLNSEFYSQAFTEEEQEKIALTTVIPDKDPSGNATDEPTTQDFIFILSASEATEYFRNDTARECNVTKYLVQRDEMKAKFSEWWLRSLGEDDLCITRVEGYGGINLNGYCAASEIQLRPVLWLDIS